MVEIENQSIKIIPLGGLGEIGKNMYLVEYDNELVIIDAGIKFPDNELFGVDYIIPNYSYLIENSNRIKGIFITHGHEDHIGGIPFLLKHVQIPIYAGKLALGFIKHKLEEHNLLRESTLHVISEEDCISFENLNISFFRTTHSIPDSYGIVVNTPLGNIVHTGDFKFDLTPVGKEPDLIRMAEIGANGVLCLLSDSTNSGVPGFSISERQISQTILEIIKNQTGRVIFATFASNVYRLQQVVKASVETNRKVVVMGRSMERAISLGIEYGYIDAPKETLISPYELKKYPADKVTILCTGSQGEPFAALSRIAEGRHRHIEIMNGDTVIFSSSPIPGNGLSVNRVINKLSRAGAEIIHHKLTNIHTSGHGAQEELKLMIRLMKPTYFVPIHGEYRMQKAHQTLAMQCGIAEPNTFILDNGDVLSFTSNYVSITDKIPANPVYVDGNGIGDVGRALIKERKVLSEHGMISIFMLRTNGVVVKTPQIISRGFVYIRQSEELMENIRGQITPLLSVKKSRYDLEKEIKETLSTFIYERLRRNPIIIVKVMDVD
ncbi:ribonuclease J1 [Bacillus sp. AK128]